MNSQSRVPRTKEQYDAYKERFSNWGRWGPDDELGTLNFITDEMRLQSSRLVTLGRTVSCADPLATKPGPRNPNPSQHYMMLSGRGSTDYIGSAYHGLSNTHIDALCHVFAADGRVYNGRPNSEVTSAGARIRSIENWRAGIVTRGVLYDIPRVRGTAFVDPESPVERWDLEDAAAAQHVSPEPGDAVLVRTGKVPFLEAHPDTASSGTPGIGVSVLEYLYETDAALFGADMTEVRGSANIPLAIHSVTIPYMGLPLLDNANLQELSQVCGELGRWEFQFIMAPLVVIGGTGSPVNPIAIF